MSCGYVFTNKLNVVEYNNIYFTQTTYVKHTVQHICFTQTTYVKHIHVQYKI